jgi:hypothetical protein
MPLMPNSATPLNPGTSNVPKVKAVVSAVAASPGPVVTKVRMRAG